MHLFSAKPAVAGVILTKCQPCWPLFYQPFNPSRVSETFPTCDCPRLLCPVHDMWGNPIYNLWKAFVVYSDNTSSPPTPHNDPCSSVSQPLHPHLAPLRLHIQLRIFRFCTSHTPTTSSFKSPFRPPLLFVCDFFFCACISKISMPFPSYRTVWEC